MTPAERKRLSRQRLLNSSGGSAELMIRLKGGTLNFIDQLAVSGNMTRPQTVQLLLEDAISRVANAAAEFELMEQSGHSEKDAFKQLESRLQNKLTPETINKYKEVLEIK